MTPQSFIYEALITFIIAISPITYLILTKKITAPFGKHQSEKWGPSLNPRVAWFLFESPNLLWCLYGYLHRDENIFDGHYANMILFSLFVIHYVNRCIIYPLRMSKGSSSVNLAILSSAFFFCSINGYLQAQTYCQFKVYPENYQYNLKFIIGVSVWLVGFIINLHSDAILRNLRQQKSNYEEITNVPRYKIPYGGFFEIVSCANFLGELIEWLGYAIASSSIAAWAFWIFVCANLIPRGISHHQWYLEKFQDYPKDRYAIIPFVI